ncbi:hypothetical protein BH23BAC3_BH23BAC3_34610 [soil metagenome]
MIFSFIFAILMGIVSAGNLSASIELNSASFKNSTVIPLHSFDDWYYRAGDDPSWASADFSPDGWQAVNVLMPAGHLPDDWNGIGWFKTNIRVDSSLAGESMAIRGRIYGGMEIYLNGEYIGGGGVVGVTAEQEETMGYFDPIHFEFDNQEVQHIAIRYSNQNYRIAWNRAPSGPSLFMGYPDVVDSITEEFREEHNRAWYIQIFQLGFFLALAMIHLILFGFYPSERANLIYGLMMGFYALAAWASGLLGETFKPDLFINYLWAEGTYVVFTSALNLFFVYAITKRKIDWLPLGYTFFGLPVLLFLFLDPINTRPFYALYFYLSMLIAIGFFVMDRIRLNRRNLNVILAAYILYFVLVIPRTLGVAFFGADFDLLWAQSIMVYYVAGFAIPIGYSVYLARDIATINRNLGEQLEKNNKLSAAKLQAEKEKKELIERQKKNLEIEVSKRTAELRKSLRELKAAQTQLVQQEKLASLGQLTAGIAHEIKNPLNFVNNFSEVSLELVEEAREEVLSAQSDSDSRVSEKAEVKSDSERSGEPRSEKSPFEGGKDGKAVQGDDTESGYASNPDLILEILDDIEANLRKIHEHGSRADGIVKSMLMHSRGGDGKMEPTPLNPLIKEYVNLAFHGMRAGKEPINVDIDLQLDENVGELPLIAEDFSRVILNLCNNAFDAMREKLTEDGGPKTGDKSPFEG